MTEVTPEGTSQVNYTYDNLYRLTNENWTGVNPFTASYAYDINSNRTQKVETVNGITETINYEYNANDQLLSEGSSADGTTVYTYDVNGSLITKINEGKFSYQYGYDLRNRLAAANITRKEGTVDVAITSSYAYNVDGIRTRALQTINGITQNRYFLLDSGHTGYSQVFEETSSLGGSVVCSYVIGDDVLSQTVNGVISYLLYDGHGSTRQLVDGNGEITDNYAYDAYGKMLGGAPNVTDRKSATNLLYAGEQFDPGMQMEYLRARYYDQNTGRFNRLDPFDGNNEDPQSLHKYAYCHSDPVNAIDPSGNMAVALLAFSGINISFSLAFLGVATLAVASVVALVYVANEIAVWTSIALQYAMVTAIDMSIALHMYKTQIETEVKQRAKDLLKMGRNLFKLPIYFVIEQITPHIYKFDASYIALKPYSIALRRTTNKATIKNNRTLVKSIFGDDKTVTFDTLDLPVWPIQLDEYPYASTYQGGHGAWGAWVPGIENAFQGGTLGALYRLHPQFKLVPESWFAVILVPDLLSFF